MSKRFFASVCIIASLLTLCACGKTETVSEKAIMPSEEEQITPPAKEPISEEDNEVIVYTDWSYITEYAPDAAPDNVYTRRYEEYTDHLIAADDYGELLPFVGEKVYYNIYAGYGLVTYDGEIVVDPVYYSARKSGSFLIMKKAVGSKESIITTVAAPDGSWCIDYYGACLGATAQAAVLANLTEIKAIGTNGETLWEKSLDELGVDPDWVSSGYYYMDEGAPNINFYGDFLMWRDYDETLSDNIGYHYIDINTGEVVIEKLITSWGNIRYFYDGLAIVRDDEADLYGYVDSTDKWVIKPQFEHCDNFVSDKALAGVSDYNYDTIIDKQGNVLRSISEGEFLSSEGPDGSMLYVQGKYLEEAPYGFCVIAAYDGNLNEVSFLKSGDVIQRAGYPHAFLKENGDKTLVIQGTMTQEIEACEEEYWAAQILPGRNLTYVENASFSGIYDSDSGKWAFRCYFTDNGDI